MHHILIAIKEIIDSNLKLYLPHVASDHLENNGAVYYMNGKDGTEFDWYINEKFPPFMVFYNDKANLGAVKLLLYKDGGVVIYLFDDFGKKLVKEVHTELKATETELFTLAVLLKDQADDKNLWNADKRGLEGRVYGTLILICQQAQDSFASLPMPLRQIKMIRKSI